MHFSVFLEIGFDFGSHFGSIAKYILCFFNFVRRWFSHRFWIDLSLIFAPLEPPNHSFIKIEAWFSKNLLFNKNLLSGSSVHAFSNHFLLSVASFYDTFRGQFTICL